MKTIIAVTLLMSSLSAFAHVFEGVSEEFCKDMQIVSDSVVHCTAANSQTVLAAKKGGDILAVPFNTYGAIDLGVIADADSNNAYFYSKWLVDASGKKVGVLTINGYYNSEMDVAGRVDVRYNMKGEIVSLEDKEIN